jgi:hypothetical protein
MNRLRQTEESQTSPDLERLAEAVSGGPLESGYVTDGETLFHIERTLVEDARGDLLVELEDCATLELIVCSVRSIAQLGLRPVRPGVLVAE